MGTDWNETGAPTTLLNIRKSPEKLGDLTEIVRRDRKGEIRQSVLEEVI